MTVIGPGYRTVREAAASVVLTAPGVALHEEAILDLLVDGLSHQA
ncbi:hypothetical protein [Streptomyces sp. WAC 01529]|nr:hypothetical protein [Streptomyces sp. WAC 01529]